MGILYQRCNRKERGSIVLVLHKISGCFDWHIHSKFHRPSLECGLVNTLSGGKPKYGLAQTGQLSHDCLCAYISCSKWILLFHSVWMNNIWLNKRRVKLLCCRVRAVWALYHRAVKVWKLRSDLFSGRLFVRPASCQMNIHGSPIQFIQPWPPKQGMREIKGQFIN